MDFVAALSRSAYLMVLFALSLSYERAAGADTNFSIGNLKNAMAKLSCVGLTVQPCEALKNGIAIDEAARVIDPIVSSDIYKKTAFDRYIGKCRHLDLRFNEGVHNIKYQAKRDFRLYTGNIISEYTTTVILFARGYLQYPDSGNGRDTFSGYSIVDTNKCAIGPVIVSVFDGADVKADQTGIVYTQNTCYIVDWIITNEHRTSMMIYRLLSAKGGQQILYTMTEK
jgi:hypothetical protein